MRRLVTRIPVLLLVLAAPAAHAAPAAPAAPAAGASRRGRSSRSRTRNPTWYSPAGAYCSTHLNGWSPKVKVAPGSRGAVDGQQLRSGRCKPATLPTYRKGTRPTDMAPC